MHAGKNKTFSLRQSTVPCLTVPCAIAIEYLSNKFNDILDFKNGDV